MCLGFNTLSRKITLASRDNSNSLIAYNTYQIVGIIFVSTFNRPIDDLKILLFLIIGAFVLFRQFYMLNSFHSIFLTKLMAYLSVVNAWTTLCLCIAYVSNLLAIDLLIFVKEHEVLEFQHTFRLNHRVNISICDSFIHEDRQRKIILCAPVQNKRRALFGDTY